MNSIIITLSDIDGGVVIMDSTHYSNKITESFNDKNIIQTITKYIVIFNKPYKKIPEEDKF